MKRADIVASVLLVILSAITFSIAEGYKNVGAQVVYFGAAFFPQLLCGAIVFCAGLQVAYAVRGKSLRMTDHIDRRGFVRMIVAFALAILYWATIDWTGFILATPVFLYVLMAVMGAKGWIKMLGSAIGTPLVIWLLFEKLLIIDLPPGVIIPVIFGD